MQWIIVSDKFTTICRDMHHKENFQVLVQIFFENIQNEGLVYQIIPPYTWYMFIVLL